MIQRIKDTVENIALVGVAVGTVYFGILFPYMLLTNEKTIKDSGYSIEKLSLSFTNTEFERYSHKDAVFKSHPFKSDVHLVDGGSFGERDGLVDYLYISGSHEIKGSNFELKTGLLYRNKDYKEFKEEFDKADRLLAETKERFAEDIEEADRILAERKEKTGYSE